MTELTDEEKAEEIIRRDSLKELNDNQEKVRRAIDRTIQATIKANYQCDRSFCVSWGIHLWYVCDLNGVIDGPFAKQKAHDISSLFNQIAGGR